MKYGADRAFLVESMAFCIENLRDFGGCGISEEECQEPHFKAGVGDKFLFNRTLDTLSDEELKGVDGSSRTPGRVIPLLKDSYYSRYGGFDRKEDNQARGQNNGK